MIAGFGVLHGRFNRDEEYFSNVHEVIDHNAVVLSAVMARVLVIEQGVTATTAQLQQLGKDAKEKDETLDNALRGQLSQVTTRLEEKNTEFMGKFALSESSIWEKIALLDAAATGAAGPPAWS